MGRLEGKVALVTGAARGQGEAEAREFVAEGAQVVLADVLDDIGAKVAEQWAAAVDLAASTFGRLDVLINNAGILRLGMLESQPLEEYMAVINVNQVGCWLGMQAAVPALKAAGGGAIVNTSSTSGFVGTMGLSAYTASKFAVRGMTKCAAMELGSYNIRVNSVHPGGIDTEMVAGPEFGSIDKDLVYGSLPVPRIGRPDEVAKLMVFLASDDASYCSGAEYLVDGGMLAGPTMPTR
jgi:3alpha(or 20beta)-hydroxysteroid dehydrogenase